MSRLIMAAVCAAALGLSSAPVGAVPQVLQYQGRLTDAAGEPLHGPANVTFSIYGEEEGGEALWTQTFENLALDNGRFSVDLGGEDAPFTPELLEVLRDGADLYLGIQVGEADELSPRQRIASVVYGIRAALADTAEFAPESDHAATADTAEVAREVVGLPGIAWQATHRATVSAGSSVSVASVTITTPADGYILVSASGTLVLDHRSGGGILCHANIGEDLDADPETEMGLSIANVDSDDLRVNHYIPFHSQRVYEKPAGTHTFHLNVSVRSAEGSASANRPSIVALFLPAAYGTTGGEEAARSSATGH